MRWETRNLQELPKFRDGLSYLYLEHGRLEQDAKSVSFLARPEGEEGEVVGIPAAALGALLLGPGTTITHAAVKALAENGCTVMWVGEDMTRFYAGGTGETRSSERLLRQVEAWADPLRRLAVVRRLYTLRFPEPLELGLTLEQVRGREGVRVREAYARASRETGVPWHGRNYQRGAWQATDPVNRAISLGNAYLYGLAHAAIVSSGFSPALGFIHTGKQLSFVFDVADVYKMTTVVPAAFAAVAEGEQGAEARLRARLREHLRTERVLERIVADLLSLFENPGSDTGPNVYDQDAARPGELWDPSGNVPGGVAYGGDDPREGAQ